MIVEMDLTDAKKKRQ